MTLCFSSIYKDFRRLLACGRKPFLNGPGLFGIQSLPYCFPSPSYRDMNKVFPDPVIFTLPDSF